MFNEVGQGCDNKLAALNLIGFLVGSTTDCIYQLIGLHIMFEPSWVGCTLDDCIFFA